MGLIDSIIGGRPFRTLSEKVSRIVRLQRGKDPTLGDKIGRTPWCAPITGMPITPALAPRVGRTIKICAIVHWNLSIPCIP